MSFSCGNYLSSRFLICLRGRFMCLYRQEYKNMKKFEGLMEGKQRTERRTRTGGVMHESRERKGDKKRMGNSD